MTSPALRASGRVAGAFLVGSAVAALLASLVAAAAWSQEVAQLGLVSQSAYVGADGVFTVELAWSGPLDESHSLTFTILGRAVDAEALEASGGDVLNRSREPVPLTALSRTERGTLLAELPIRSFSPGDPARVLIPDAGVYPVVVEVRGPDGPLSSVATQLIRLSTDSAEADVTPIAVVLPVGDKGLSLPDATALLEAYPTVPVTTLVGPLVLDILADDPAAAEGFRDALGGRPVVSAHRRDLDPSALAEIGQGSLFEPVLQATSSELRMLGLEPAAGIVAFDGPITAAGARLLIKLGVVAVLDTSGDRERGGMLTTPEGSLSILPVDRALSAELRNDDFAVSRAHRLLARLALREGRSPVVLGGPTSSRPSPAALDTVFTAIAQAGLLEGVQLSPSLAFGPSVVPDERSAQDLRPLAVDVDRVLGLLETYRSFHMVGGIAPRSLELDVVAALSRDLDPARRAVELADVEAQLEEAFGVVTLPGFQSVTLAAQQSVLPMALHNGASGSRRVLLRFESDKIEVSADGQIIELSPGASSLDIEVETRSVGVSPLEMSVLTPDGQRELARARFQVRSTAVPGLGLLLSGVGLILLALWWSRSILRDRREKARLELAVSAGALPTEGPSSTDAVSVTGRR